MIEESKFISNETMGYLKAKAGIDMNSRLNDIEQYLQKLLDHMDKVEVYRDSQLSEVQSQVQELINRQDSIDANYLKAGANQITQLENLKQTLKILSTFVIVAGFFAIGMGVALWLIK